MHYCIIDTLPEINFRRKYYCCCNAVVSDLWLAMLKVKIKLLLHFFLIPMAPEPI